MQTFEQAVLAARERIGSGPPVVRSVGGVVIPYYGQELIETRQLPDGSQIDFHLLRRTLGLWIVTAAFDVYGNLIVVLQYKYGVNEVTIQLSPGGVQPPKGVELTQDVILGLAAEGFRQETGYGAGQWRYMRGLNVDDNKVRKADGSGPLTAHLVMATDLRLLAAPQPRSTDFYEVLVVPPREFRALVESPYLTEISAAACLYEALARRGMMFWK